MMKSNKNEGPQDLRIRRNNTDNYYKSEKMK